MKKILGLIAVVGMLFAFAGQAAAFSAGDLVLVAYDVDNKEVAINLGSLSTEIDLATDSNVVLAEAGSLSLDQFSYSYYNSEGTLVTNSASSWSDVNLQYFGATYTNNMYFATTETSAPSYTTNFMGQFLGASFNLYGDYTSLAEGSDIAVDVADEPQYIYEYDEEAEEWVQKDNQNYGSNSYDGLMNNPEGTYAGYLTVNEGYANLAELNEGGIGYVDMYLYNVDTITLDTDEDGDASTPYIATLRLYADGSVVLNPVPIPGSVLLLGSGLLGLFGIRRKKA